ncbi:TFIIH complex subunit TFB5 [Ascoidea rubescens DSM 1968]|uniref:General transcription and DNA repair factor IIH subunit TFB5 n=1 Tax=Ascoidea rubescens DSM 1968 TaxID=1344418 RepID=A0A1D2VPM6_9ASCO|nr:nucleotide excision repair, TFIIH, subunit [Ascoidea rubescens DSM 1968]ODV63534.1 nucleotide excision repair, TFIIH, subunit [Ascoidea rubescens DSM 1968]
MVRAISGALVQCDPSITALVLKIDKENNNSIIIEQLDDTHLVVDPSRVTYIKRELNNKLAENIYSALDDEAAAAAAAADK